MLGSIVPFFGIFATQDMMNRFLKSKEMTLSMCIGIHRLMRQLFRVTTTILPREQEIPGPSRIQAELNLTPVFSLSSTRRRVLRLHARLFLSKRCGQTQGMASLI